MSHSSSPSEVPARAVRDGQHLAVLDGWRAVSILLVLATHMLPLGPKHWQINSCTGLMGMSLFFTLSGFLITSSLLKSQDVPTFLIRRLTRIIPLAWLTAAVFLTVLGRDFWCFVNNLLFLTNYRHEYMTPLTGHFWSLCVEVHFYLLVALMVLMLGRRGLLLLPVLGLAVTAWRVSQGVSYSVETHLRGDEIMAGAILALVWSGELGRAGRLVSGMLQRLPWPVVALAFALASHQAGGGLTYARPYLGMALVGVTLLRPERAPVFLGCRPMRYVAEISYALYLIHPVLLHGWLGDGDTTERYVKRLFGVAVIFAVAHLLTYYYERPMTALGKALGRRRSRRPEPVPRVGSVPAADSPGLM